MSNENKSVSITNWLKTRKDELIKTVDAIREGLREHPDLFGVYAESLSEIRGALKLIGELEVGLSGKQPTTDEGKGE
jgi:hypothetical protein